MSPGDRGHDPPTGLRRLLLAILPGDDWSRAFVDELDAEHRRVASERGRLPGALWYLRQILSPETARFVWLVRQRRRRTGSWNGATDRDGDREGGMRETGAGRWLGGWWRDLRHAARGLGRDPRLAAFVVATLALGIGGTSAMFGIVDRLFLRGPAHVEAPGELVRLYLRFDDRAPERRTTQWIPFLTAEAIREGSTGFRGVALHRSEEVLARVRGRTRPLRMSEVGRGYFDLLGVSPAAGRFFDGPPTGAEGDVAVISHELWTSAFGGARDVLGSTVELAERSPVVVGVAPPGFTGPTLAPLDVWIPLETEAADNRNWNVIARIGGDGADGSGPGPADGAGLDRAVAAADRIHRATDPGRFFQWAVGGELVSAPLGSDDTGSEPAEAAVARLLTAVTLLVLLIGIANVVNLLLARLTRRRREVAVRMALGVGRWPLARLLLSESVGLALLGGLAALPVAWGGGLLVRDVLLPHVAWPASPLQGRVLAVTVLVTLPTGLLVGLLPAHRANRTDVSAALRATGRGGGLGRSRLHLGLAAAQITFSAALLVCAGLFMKSFWTLRVTDLGVDAEAVTAFTLRSLDPSGIPRATPEEHRLYRRALDAVAGDPGVAGAAVSLGLPFLYNFGLSVAVPGMDSIPALPGGGPYLTAATEGYFAAVGTGIVLGRDFTRAEVEDDEPVLVVSRSMAGLLWPGEDPLGRCVRVGDPTSPCSRVVGVAEDVHRVGYREPPSLQYYVPLAPSERFGGMALVVRPHPGDDGVLARVRARLRELDPAVDYVEATGLAEAIEGQVRPWRLGTWVLGTAALLALLVALVGVYGVLSYLVEQRRREMGIRIALGASGTGIRGLVLRTGLTATLLGLVVGIGAVVAAGPLLRPLLFETEVADPVVLASVAGVLLASAALACLQPAGRAARVQPASCLKEE